MAGEGSAVIDSEGTMSSMNTHPEFKMTRRRVLTRRGVLWLGQTCNLRCQFCYFIDRVKAQNHPEHPFMSLEKAEKICTTLADYYHNNSIDIQGGEPTIHPEIEAIVTHCRSIGLLPTLITNAVVLADKKKCEKLRDAGVRDYLVSVHGLGDTYDRMVGLEGAHAKQMKALENFQSLSIPFRFNCVLSSSVLPILDRIGELAIKSGARVVNFIVFNPFEDQRKRRQHSSENVPRHMEIMPVLDTVLDRLEDAGIEGNVRYFPICMVAERHRKSIYNFQQVSYDIHEWDYASGSWTGIQSQKMRDGELSPVVSLEEATAHLISYRGCMKYIAGAAKAAIARFPELKEPVNSLRKKFSSSSHTGVQSSPLEKEKLYRENARRRVSASYVYGKACQNCDVQGICDGFQKGYADMFGTDEAQAIKLGSTVEDPAYYIRQQDKVVEEEDYDWAL